MKVGKKREKTEPEKLLEEITPEEEKVSIEKFKWELAHTKEELKDREMSILIYRSSCGVE